jgi:hypothetical protein
MISRDASGAGFAANPLGKPAPQTRNSPQLAHVNEVGLSGLPAIAAGAAEPAKKDCLSLAYVASEGVEPSAADCIAVFLSCC